MERRFTPFMDVEIESRDGAASRIRGYGAVFYDGSERTEYKLWDDLVERIMPGSFDKAIAEDDVRALFNHDPNMLLGRTTAKTLALSVDKRGLRYEIDPPDTETGRNVVAAVKRRDLTGSSFSFKITDQEFRTEGGIDIREIKGVRLYDVGPVTFPAYEATTVEAKSAHHGDARAEYEAWKRSNRERIFMFTELEKFRLTTQC